MILFIDWSNLMYRCLFISIKQDPFDENFKLWRHIVFKCLMDDLKLFSPDEVVVAGDGKNPWRRTIYPEYKASRGKARADVPVDFDKFFQVADEYWEELKGVFPNFKWLKHNSIEADDIVGVLVKNIHKNCVAITTDKDYIQLLRFSWFRLFNPIKNEEVKSLNPKRDLDVKCICGDTSDNITGIKRGIGPKRAEKLLTEGKLGDFLDSDEEAKNAYIRNRQLIDMESIPGNVQNEILEEYKSYPAAKLDTRKFQGFVMKNSPSMIMNMAALANALIKIEAKPGNFGEFVD